MVELGFDGGRQELEEVAVLFAAGGDGGPWAFVIALVGFDDVDESAAALANVNSNSAT